jgi:hypothetical protein
MGTLNAQAYAQGQFVEEDPFGIILMVKITSGLNGIRGTLRRYDRRREKVINVNKTTEALQGPDESPVSFMGGHMRLSACISQRFSQPTIMTAHFFCM